MSFADALKKISDVGDEIIEKGMSKYRDADGHFDQEAYQRDMDEFRQENELKRQEDDLEKYIKETSQRQEFGNWIDSKASPAIEKYARQINEQLKQADIPVKERNTIVSTAVEGVFRPLAGFGDINVADYKISKSGLRKFWEKSKSSIDLSDGLNIELVHPQASRWNPKSSFIINVPQHEVTRILRDVYKDLEKEGMTVDDLIKNDKGSDTLGKFLGSLKPNDFSISVKEPSGKIRPVTHSDDNMFLDLVTANVMEMNKEEVIDLSKIAGQKKAGNNGGVAGFFKRKVAEITTDVASYVANDYVKDEVFNNMRDLLSEPFYIIVGEQEKQANGKQKEKQEIDPHIMASISRGR